jgi:NADPH-dependent glutamate synthase beta subunit-like oxidoreductase
MQREIRWRRRRWFAPLLSGLFPGLGQAYTGRYGPAAAYFLFAISPVVFLAFLWRDPSATSLLEWRHFNTGHWIMLPFFLLFWVVNVVDAFRGSTPPQAPCVRACPAHIQIPHYINLVLENRLEECHELICRWTPLVGTIGHVCHHPCEKRCTRHDFDEPVAICPIKAFVGNHMIANQLLPAVPKPALREGAPRVAVIGSGPAGLTAAFFLSRAGLRPTIFEALPVAGGMLAVGIPAYRLPRTVLQAEIDFVRENGVEIRTGHAVGKDLSLDDLFAEGYQTIIAAPGTHREAKLRVKGEEKEGVVGGLGFLRKVNLGQADPLAGPVVVVGGGNVAMDAARCALRLGASPVTVVYRRSRQEMPANAWEIEEAEAEGVHFRFLTNPVLVLGEGAVEGVECLEMRLGEPDASGRRAPVPVEGSGFTIPCRHLIPAIGLAPETSFLEGTGARLSPAGLILTRPRSMKTHRRGLLAAGDAVLGASSVIQASAHGREAAIQLALVTSRLGPFALRELKVGPFQGEFAARARVPQVSRDPTSRAGDFRLIHQIYGPDAALSEARRCLRCDVEV